MKRRLFFVELAVLLGAVPGFPAAVFAKIPNDPLALQWAYEDAVVPAAWERVTGSRDVVVAVVDNGFDTFHPDLYENAWKNEKEIPDNGLDDDGNGYADDVWGWNFVPEDTNRDGDIDETEQLGNNDPRPPVVGIPEEEKTNKALHHGTAVAGIIGAVGDNGVFGAGLNWKVRLMNVKIVDNTGVGTILHFDRAIRYAVDNGADIINVSLVSDEKPGLREAIKYAYDHGVAVIAAAGNEGVFLGGFPRYPVCSDAGESEQLVLGVSAIDETHHLAPFSNYGGDCIDITAPGVNVSSTIRYAPQYGFPDQYRGGWRGTSFAAPIVSGTAALLKSIHPEWGPKEIYKTLVAAVNKTPTQHEDEYRQLFGAGRVQTDKAVTLAMETVRPSHRFSHLLAVDEKTGRVEERARDVLVSVDSASPIRAGDAVAAVSHGNKVYTVVVKEEKKRGKTVNAVVTVYTGQWQKRASWNMPAKGPMTVAAGDILGDDAPEVIVAPAYADKRVYDVFSLFGALIHRVDEILPHKGVTLGLAWRGNTGKRDVLAVYDTRGSLAIHHMNGDKEEVRQILIPALNRVGAVSGGDTDGDGLQEYMIAFPDGAEPRLTFYDENGDFMQEFYALPSELKTGIRMAVGDYDGDGKDDIAVAPARGRGVARIVNGGAQILAEWDVSETGIRQIVATYHDR